MASNAIKPTLLRNVAKRGFAAQAAVNQSSSSVPSQETKVSNLPNGGVVASVESNAPVSRVALLFKAGSRYESPNNMGASHMLRFCVGLGTKNNSSFSVTRKLQQVGGSLSCETGREHIVYGIDLIRDNVGSGLEILGDVSTQPSFKPWEMKDSMYRIQDELASLDPSTIAIELLHQAAYRNTGLGNSLFIPKHLVGSLTEEKLGDFLASTHTTSRMAVVGQNIDHDALVSFAGSLGISSNSGASSTGVFGGGELRQETGSPVTVIAVAGPGASVGSSDAAALAVAQQILGTGAHIKRGNNVSGALSGALASFGGLGSASALNINYSDGGLFGYFIIADSSVAGQVLGTVHNTVKSLNITDADVARAKKQTQAAILMATESAGVALEDMGLQALLTGKYATPSAAAAAVDGVTAGAVQAALSKAMGGKLSMGAVGSLYSVPYLDQL